MSKRHTPHTHANPPHTHTLTHTHLANEGWVKVQGHAPGPQQQVLVIVHLID